jgi:hypothetical protein
VRNGHVEIESLFLSDGHFTFAADSGAAVGTGECGGAPAVCHVGRITLEDSAFAIDGRGVAFGGETLAAVDAIALKGNISVDWRGSGALLSAAVVASADAALTAVVGGPRAFAGPVRLESLDLDLRYRLAAARESISGAPALQIGQLRVPGSHLLAVAGLEIPFDSTSALGLLVTVPAYGTSGAIWRAAAGAVPLCADGDPTVEVSADRWYYEVVEQCGHTEAPASRALSTGVISACVVVGVIAVAIVVVAVVVLRKRRQQRRHPDQVNLTTLDGSIVDPVYLRS